MTRNEGRAVTARYLWKLSRHFPPALRLLVEIEPPANDADWSPIGGAA